MVISNNLILEVNGLSTGYGNRQVLFNVSFDVKQGEIVLLVGGNGSGKSTVMKAIYGLLSDYDNRTGNIIFSGEDVTNSKPFQMIEKGLVYVPQKNNTFEQLTLIENLQVAASTLPQIQEMEERINRVFETLPQLTKLRNKKPFHMSGGERQLLSLGMALTRHPKMIMLDEPSAGLSSVVWQQNIQIIRELNEAGISFLIVEHRLGELIEVSHRAYQVRLGKMERET